MTELPQQTERAKRIIQTFEIFADSKSYTEARRRTYELFAILGISEMKIEEYLRIAVIVKGQKFR
jgi:hypothetical protein